MRESRQWLPRAGGGEQGLVRRDTRGLSVVMKMFYILVAVVQDFVCTHLSEFTELLSEFHCM